MTITAFRVARLLQNSAAEVIEGGVLVVKDDLIEQVGSWETLKDGLDNVAIRDLGDVTLMPGLFDCHVSDLVQDINSIYLHRSPGTFADGPFKGQHLDLDYTYG